VNNKLYFVEILEKFYF